MSTRTQQQRMRVLRADGRYDHEAHARGLLETASNPWSATNDPEGRRQTIDIARAHADLALAQAMHDLTDVLSTVWGDVSRELVMWRASRQASGTGPNGEGRKV